MAAEKYQNAAGELNIKSKVINSQIRLKEKKLGELQAKYEEYTNSFFRPETAREFLDSIQATAEESGCFVDTLKFAEPNPLGSSRKPQTAKFVENRVSLTVIGLYPNIVQMINRLQDRTEKVWVDAINLHLKDESQGYLVCDMTITIYVMKNVENESDG